MDLQEIVRRLRMNQSIKAIKRETGKHRSVIRRARELAEQEGWLDAADLPGERQLRERYHESSRPSAAAAHPLDAHREQIDGWLKEHYSFLVIHKLLTGREVEYSETNRAPLLRIGTFEGGAAGDAARDQARRGHGGRLRSSRADLGHRHALAAPHVGVLRAPAPFAARLPGGGVQPSAARAKSHYRGRLLEAATEPEEAGVRAQNETLLLLNLLAYELLHAGRCVMERATGTDWSLRRWRERVLRVASHVARHGRRLTFVIAEDAAPDWQRLWGKLAALDCAPS